MYAELIRKPIERHPFRPHRWADLDMMVGFLGIAKQCQKCYLVEVTFPLTMLSRRGSHEMLQPASNT